MGPPSGVVQCAGCSPSTHFHEAVDSIGVERNSLLGKLCGTWYAERTSCMPADATADAMRNHQQIRGNDAFEFFVRIHRRSMVGVTRLDARWTEIGQKLRRSEMRRFLAALHEVVALGVNPRS